MSRRTAEASKAIRLAWENERELISKGKGTRNWTPEQQQQILDEGRAKDDDGRAFEGHHMKNVSDHPEYQGEPGNIQFLSRNEHLNAHGGDWKNQTNGYYDPLTGQTKDFGLNEYEPCEVIELSEPIVELHDDNQYETENDEETIEPRETDSCDEEVDEPSTSSTNEQKYYSSNSSNKETESLRGGGGAKHFFKSYVAEPAVKAVKFCWRHRGAIGMGLSIVGGLIGNAAERGNPSTKSYATDNSISNSSSEKVKMDIDVPIATPTKVAETAEKVKRASPIEHEVRGYERVVKGKKQTVKGYPRGKKKE